VKQNVSAPIAAIVIALVILGSIVYFSRPNAAKAPQEDVFVLPYEPPVQDTDLQLLHQGLAPLGIACVWPPLASDRFKGARVALVGPGSPADRGGMKPGDLITKFSGLPIPNPLAVAGALQRVNPKKPSTVIVVRAGKEQTLTIAGLKPPPHEESLP